MNSLELTACLFDMASQQNKYDLNICTAIINAIIAHYMVTKGFYESNAIRVFKHFLSHGALIWRL